MSKVSIDQSIEKRQMCKFSIDPDAKTIFGANNFFGVKQFAGTKKTVGAKKNFVWIQGVVRS